MSKTIALINQKGGVGKTTNTINIGAALVLEGKKVLLIDGDPQAFLTSGLGISDPEELKMTLYNVFEAYVNDPDDIDLKEIIMTHEEGMDFIPNNIRSSGLEITLGEFPGYEFILKSFISKIKDNYDYILIDCPPSLGRISFNALTAADSLIIPLKPTKYSIDGLKQLTDIVHQTKRILNPDLDIEGLLISMVDLRTNYARGIVGLLEENYKNEKKGFIFEAKIPLFIRADECSAAGVSIFLHDPKGKVAQSYRDLAKEIISNG